jgi:hypothetical protein
MGESCLGGECNACGTFGIDPCSADFPCGRTSDGNACFCMASAETAETACVQADLNHCFACTADDDCSTHLGKPALCVDLSGWSCVGSFCRDQGDRFCMAKCA